jgi:FAD-linked sulfhydryl oxidase
MVKSYHSFLIFLLITDLIKKCYSATEFQAILAKHPPQVSSREAASQWACAVHNIVNERLKKEIFDCGKIAEKYKCGC